MGEHNTQSAWWFRIGLWVLWSLALADTVGAQGAVSFIARKDFQVGANPQSVFVGDFNGDGHLDLATPNPFAAAGVSVVSVFWARVMAPSAPPGTLQWARRLCPSREGISTAMATSI